MASCVAAVTGASVVPVAGCSTSAPRNSGSSGAVSSTSLASKRSFYGPALRTYNGNGNVRRSVGFVPLTVKATSSGEAPPDASKQLDQLIADAKAKWETVENKPTVAVYAGGALVALWLSSTIIGAVNSVPLLPKILELVGLGYTGWFVYRYLLFKSSRKELVSDIEELKGKITGATKDITGKEEAPPVDPFRG